MKMLSRVQGMGSQPPARAAGKRTPETYFLAGGGRGRSAGQECGAGAGPGRWRGTLRCLGTFPDPVAKRSKVTGPGGGVRPEARWPPSRSPLSRADGHICGLTGTAGDALLVSCCSFIFAGIFFFF